MKALVFDCDGVLAETERDGHRVAFNQMFDEQGLGLSWSTEDYAERLTVAGGRERLMRLCTDDFVRSHGLPTDPAELEGVVRGWHRRKTEIFVGMVRDGLLEPRPGVRRLAEDAHDAGWVLGVASTSAQESVCAIADRALGDLMPHHIVVVAGDMVAHKKPAPDVYVRALADLGSRPEDSAAIEDSAIGVASARAAGMSVVATQSHYTREEDLGGARIVVDSLGEPGGPQLRVVLNTTRVPVGDYVGVAHLEACVGAGVS
ncbi:MAG TPA: HAD-IA family hydrolase [Nocardioides sp.]|uniref:HAD-IA family hydrolase n=1 Tax=Nocardioides sp. TaxID=35761 RepID=UPI002E376C5D|nr:HAD-IA family hydrolase [Nocardioides sp.]HEX3929393.1 HAD-IA family hydrolase [Nocardioides sp.]